MSQPSLLAALREDAPRAYACAQKVLLVLQMQLKQSLTRDELTYLTIHIARLARDMWALTRSACSIKRPGGFPVAFSMPRNLRLRIPVRVRMGNRGVKESGVGGF